MKFGKTVEEAVKFYLSKFRLNRPLQSAVANNSSNLELVSVVQPSHSLCKRIDLFKRTLISEGTILFMLNRRSEQVNVTKSRIPRKKPGKFANLCCGKRNPLFCYMDVFWSHLSVSFDNWLLLQTATVCCAEIWGDEISRSPPHRCQISSKLASYLKRNCKNKLSTVTCASLYLKKLLA